MHKNRRKLRHRRASIHTIDTGAQKCIETLRHRCVRYINTEIQAHKSAREHLDTGAQRYIQLDMDAQKYIETLRHRRTRPHTNT